MAQSKSADDSQPSAVNPDFETEAARLIAAERSRASADAGLRMRALAQISERLSTVSLVELAVAVGVAQSSAPISAPISPRLQ